MKCYFKLSHNQQQHTTSPWVVALGGVLLLSPAAGIAAVCTGAEPYARVYANVPSPITVRPDISIGQVIGSTVSTFPGGRTGYGCAVGPLSTGGIGSVIVMGAGTPNGTLYPTGIPGLSYRAKFTAVWGVSSIFNVAWPVTGTFRDTTFSSEGGYNGGSITIELVKTGPIPGSITWDPGVLGTIQVVTNGKTYNFLEFYHSDPVVVVPENPSCTVTQSAISVNLEDANTSQLVMAGDTSKDKTFSIPLTCTSDVNIALGFSGDIADNTNAVFRNLSGSANASSVGVQILNGGTPVPTTAGNYLNLGVVNGSMSVPLIARYYALANNADAGTVNAIAYASIVYN